MKDIVKNYSEALQLWTGDTRTLAELKDDFMKMAAENGEDLNTCNIFLNIFIPNVIESRKKRIVNYYSVVWKQCRRGRERVKMKAAALCGFFEREAAQ